MINPEINDWWSHKKLTTLRYDGTKLGGAGVSMQVLAKAIETMDAVWFSLVHGEFNDNLLLVAVNYQIARSLPKKRYDINCIKRGLFGEPLHNEFILTDIVTTKLGLVINGDVIGVSNKQIVSLTISSHDNCFFSIDPAPKDLLSKVVHAVFEQHSYYMGKEIDWENVESGFIDVLYQLKEVSIQSDPKRTCLWIPQIEKNKGLFWNRSHKGSIIIRDGEASFRETSILLSLL